MKGELKPPTDRETALAKLKGARKYILSHYNIEEQPDEGRAYAILLNLTEELLRPTPQPRRATLTAAQAARYEQLFEIAANEYDGESFSAAGEDAQAAHADAAAWQGLVEEWPELAAYEGSDCPEQADPQAGIYYHPADEPLTEYLPGMEPKKATR